MGRHRMRRSVPCNHQCKRDDELREALEHTGCSVSLPLLKSRRIVWVRTGTERARRDWEEVARRFAFLYFAVEEIGSAKRKDNTGRVPGWVTVFDVSSHYDLEALFAALPDYGYYGVEKWEYAVAGASVHYGGAVSGNGNGVTVQRKTTGNVSRETEERENAQLPTRR